MLESLFVVFSSTAAKLQQKTCIGFVLYRKSLIEGEFWWILSLIEGFLPFFLCPFKHYLYICQRFWKGSRHNGKGAYLALCSWLSETSQTSCTVNEHSNGRCSRDVLIHIPLLVWLIASSDKSYIRMGKVYTYRRGLRRCSFNNTGQCEGLDSWDG